MTTQQPIANVRLQTRVGLCPTCGQVGTFTFLGEQRWPPRVVAATGLGPVVHLWQCNQCQTTLTETASETQD
ncbi:MAG: hypothetical protein HZC41_23990 [Chloroflexi bacterium]|nr:hypothetical protein [Chloroflexota bacterium]